MEKRKQKQCKNLLERLSTQTKKDDYCKLCYKKIKENNYVSFIRKRKYLCYKCFLKLGSNLRITKYKNIEILRICRENEYIRQVMFQYIVGEDYELKDIFLEYYIDYLKVKFKGYKIYYLSLDEDKTRKRYFNKVEEIYKCLNLETIKNSEDLRGYSKILIGGIAVEYHKNYLEIIKNLNKRTDKKMTLMLIY